MAKSRIDLTAYFEALGDTGLVGLPLGTAATHVGTSEQNLRRMIREGVFSAHRDEKGRIFLTQQVMDAYIAGEYRQGRTSGGGSSYKGMPSYFRQAKAVRAGLTKTDLSDYDIDPEAKAVAVEVLDAYVKAMSKRATEQAAKKASEGPKKSAKASREEVIPEGTEDGDIAELLAE